MTRHLFASAPTNPLSASRPVRSADVLLPVYPVCPHCKRELARHSVDCGGYAVTVYANCPEHGKVSPIPSHVVNRYPAMADC